MPSIPVILKNVSIFIADVNPKNKEKIIGTEKERKVDIQVFPDRSPIFGFQATELNHTAYKDILLAVQDYSQEVKAVRFALKLDGESITKSFKDIQKNITSSIQSFEEKYKVFYEKKIKKDKSEEYEAQIKQLEKTYKIPNKRAVLEMDIDLKTLRLVEKVLPKQNNEKKALDNKTKQNTVESEAKSN